MNIIHGGILALQNQCAAGVEQAPFQAFPLRSREQSELILSAALLSSLTLFHVQLRGKCPHSEAKAPIIIENLGSIFVRAKPGPNLSKIILFNSGNQQKNLLNRVQSITCEKCGKSQ